MEPNTMKIFATLFIVFVPGINSQISFNVQGYVGGFVSTTFCTTGHYLDNAASDIKSICSSLDGKNRLDLAALYYLCGSPFHTFGYVTNVLIPYCQSASEDPTLLPELPTLLPTLPTLLPTLPTELQEIETLLPTLPTELADIVTDLDEAVTSDLPDIATVLADVVTDLPDISTLLPTLPTALPTIPTALPTIPTALPTIPTILPAIATLLPTLPPLIPTTKKPCNSEQMDRCIDICKRRASFDLNLGPQCTPRKYGASDCHCKKVTHCDVYKNETCFDECKRYGPETKTCKIPEAGLTCVCEFYSGNTRYYRAKN